MTDENPLSGEITTAVEFATGLRQLLAETLQNDVDVRGAWVYHNDDGPDLELIIYELETNPETD